MYRILIYLCFIATFMFSCNSDIDVIIPVDMNIVSHDSLVGKSQEFINRNYRNFKRRIRINTLNKMLPEVRVRQDLNEAEEKLTDLLQEKTILISTDLHCGAGQGYVFEEFPKIHDLLEKELSEWNVLLLVKTIPRDSSSNEKMKGKISELNRLYKNIYFIREKDAYVINLISNPTVFYLLNEEVVAIHSGLMLDSKSNYNLVYENILELSE